MIFYRGSLTQCRDALANAFRYHKHCYLSIVCAPSAKYYYVADDDELTSPTAHAQRSDHRLLLRCTLKELRIICEATQFGLEFEEYDGAD